MKKSIYMILVLTVVGLFSGLVLFATHNYTEPLILENEASELKEAIFKVLPNTESYRLETEDGVEIFRGFDSKGRSTGIAFIAEGPGYQGIIRIMVGTNENASIVKGIYVLQSTETPGLGSRITELDFRKQFIGLSTRPAIEYIKNAIPTRENQIQAITGATVSSAAVVNLINKRVEEVRNVLRVRR